MELLTGSNYTKIRTNMRIYHIISPRTVGLKAKTMELIKGGTQSVKTSNLLYCFYSCLVVWKHWWVLRHNCYAIAQSNTKLCLFPYLHQKSGGPC